MPKKRRGRTPTVCDRQEGKDRRGAQGEGVACLPHTRRAARRTVQHSPKQAAVHLQRDWDVLVMTLLFPEAFAFFWPRTVPSTLA